MVCRRGIYKPGIYGDRGECSALRGRGKTAFLNFLREDATLSSRTATPTTLDQAVFEGMTTMTDGQNLSLDPCCKCAWGN